MLSFIIFCFVSMLIVFAFVGAFIAIDQLSKKNDQNAPPQTPYCPTNIPVKKTLKLPYYKKKWFFPKSEQAFFEALRQAVGHKVFIFPHVRLWDIIDLPKNADNYMTFRNKIQSKHVDFVLVNPTTYEPMIVIELDGASHKRQKQKQSDDVKDAALSAADMPILRLQVGNEYDPEALKACIAAKLQGA